MSAKICLSKIDWFVSEHRQLSLLTIASRYYHEFKQKLLMSELQCQINRTFDIRSFSDDIRSKLI